MGRRFHLRVGKEDLPELIWCAGQLVVIEEVIFDVFPIAWIEHEGIVGGGRPDFVEPRFLVGGTGESEGGARELLGDEVELAFLRAVLALGNSSLEGLSFDVVAEADEILQVFVVSKGILLIHQDLIIKLTKGCNIICQYNWLLSEY